MQAVVEAPKPNPAAGIVLPQVLPGEEFDRADYGMSLYTEGGAGHIVLRIQVEALRDEGDTDD